MLDKKRTIGVDFSEFTGCNISHPVKGLLYYSEGKLTDKHYIKNVYTWNGIEFVNNGEHLIHVLGECKEGDYLTTCTIRGAAMVTDNKEVAFARATKSRIPDVDNKFYVLGVCYAAFL